MPQDWRGRRLRLEYTTTTDTTDTTTACPRTGADDAYDLLIALNVTEASLAFNTTVLWIVVYPPVPEVTPPPPTSTFSPPPAAQSNVHTSPGSTLNDGNFGALTANGGGSAADILTATMVPLSLLLGCFCLAAVWILRRRRPNTYRVREARNTVRVLLEYSKSTPNTNSVREAGNWWCSGRLLRSYRRPAIQAASQDKYRQCHQTTGP